MRYIISLLMISLVLAVELQAKKKHRPGDPIVTYTGEAPCVGISNPKNVATCCYGTYRQGGITHPLVLLGKCPQPKSKHKKKPPRALLV
ncbi:hypothetical protein Pst134EA_000489 [Puccinia striiformis f. sp. tritici]|uniref:hypothetical protein n=1 Tax=Puccinia striiformis f. sp. tritici TaxID=168172 RepID=UPI002007497B|nr:hypothetical protein Pst134EA_000489 [Puccinia striiformis f. sp. tritici]KAH9466635.1 hypothetical protein Pst134EB_001683 [Puccinia striiformis f. sp. tritici]KAH9473416.1 hypothetical protein Pst134EA_000489 [Puccinia striiformis f. sp. tritici]